MDPRIAVATGMLSGFVAFLGTLLVFYCGLARNHFHPWNETEIIAEPEPAFEFPTPLLLVATHPIAEGVVGKPCPVEFRLFNVSRKPVIVPGESFLNPRFRSTKGDHPSCLVEIRDDDGVRQEYVRAFSLCGLQDMRRTGDLHLIPPGNSRVVPHPMLRNWIPRAPGTYTFLMALDTRGEVAEFSYWGERILERKAIPLLRRVPRGVYVSHPVTVVVRP